MKRDLVNVRFGRLTAIEPVSLIEANRRRTHWKCVCDCGEIAHPSRDTLLRGDARSCGCLQKEVAKDVLTTHGASSSRLYRIWAGMIDRCYRREHHAYHNYGGRGIEVCAHWRHSFATFAKDVGEPPSDHHSIDRKENDRGYEPGNVRWATFQMQGRNRRGLHMVKWDGREMCLKEAAEVCRIPYKTVHRRVQKLGWTLADALTVPPRIGQKHIGTPVYPDREDD